MINQEEFDAELEHTQVGLRDGLNAKFFAMRAETNEANNLLPTELAQLRTEFGEGRTS